MDASFELDAAATAQKIITDSDAVGEAQKIDRLASSLLLGLDHYERGREFGLEVIRNLRSEAQRLGFTNARTNRHTDVAVLKRQKIA